MNTQYIAQLLYASVRFSVLQSFSCLIADARPPCNSNQQESALPLPASTAGCRINASERERKKERGTKGDKG